ncbi:host-nuclease inhibitor Gam family protein [Tepidibacter hydrothermalis]|uniref:Host-nuclease inhibitor Gam family protein n=1 Tax=Tepidibacter hydrothermalis TaxID=3036126 RepID=A0ABY8EIY5_9FIRM|nr:host-nuclease inhibitor Gam family protein [Tepidibacter hydrothermalis]WFD11995.1 host-nuclease inhibitor Gam family protein [Tepidibacter hydrothermalis]
MNKDFRLSDMFLNVGEEDRETWKIENDNVADWALDKIRESREEYKRFEDVAVAKIEQIKIAMDQEKKKMEVETSFFESKLREYFETVKTKSTKTQATYSLPAGKLVKKLDKEDFKVDREKVIEFIKENKEEYQEFVKTETLEKLDWAKFKKNLTIDNGNIIDKSTGEVLELEGLTLEVKPGKFEIKF